MLKRNVLRQADRLRKLGLVNRKNRAKQFRLAWAFEKFKASIKDGQPVTFRKTNGTLRVVNNPAPYTGQGATGMGSPRPAHQFVFIDLDKKGNQVISCDIRLLIEY